MARQLEYHLSGCGVPDLDGTIVPGGGDPFAIWAEGDPTGTGALAMSAEGKQLLAGGGVPHIGAVNLGGGKPLPVRAEGHLPKMLLVTTAVGS